MAEQPGPEHLAEAGGRRLRGRLVAGAHPEEGARAPARRRAASPGSRLNAARRMLMKASQPNSSTYSSVRPVPPDTALWKNQNTTPTAKL